MNLVKLVSNELDLHEDVISEAFRGDAFSQLVIGRDYYNAIWLDGNCKKAFHWLKLSAEQDNMEAQFRLGELYSTKLNDEDSSYKWYIKSALQGYKKALIRIHDLYHAEKNIFCRGQLTEDEKDWSLPNFKKLYHIREVNEFRKQQLLSNLTRLHELFMLWHHKLKKIGSVDAYLKLGFLYQHGYGVRKFKGHAMKCYQLAAEQGSRDAQYNLGFLFQYSPQKKWNYRHACNWYTKAARNGNSNAQYQLALLYLKGLGTAPNYTKAIYFLKQAATSQHIDAQITMGKMVRKGQGVEQSYPEATMWYKKAALQGSIVAYNCLDLLNRNTFNREANMTKSSSSASLSSSSSSLSSSSFSSSTTIVPSTPPSKISDRYPFKVISVIGLCSKLRTDIAKLEDSSEFDKLKKTAKNALVGDARAMLEIGRKYYSGTGITQNKDTALHWMFNSAKAGSNEAQCTIASMYKNGDYVEQNYLTASIWFTKAAKNKYNIAQYNLGLMYYQGLGVRKDPLEASRWYTFSSQQNNSNAQCQLGILRANGEGLHRDISEAIEWFTISAKQGNSQAIYELGKLYMNGNGIEINVSLGMKLWEKAALRGNLDAQKMLAEYYNDINYSFYNIEASFKYYKMSADKGDTESIYRLATFYLDGYGTAQDYIKAYYLFKKASDLNYRQAQNLFSVPIICSTEEDIDYEQVSIMFNLICENNIESLEYNLGYLYEIDIRFDYHYFTFTFNSNHLLALKWYLISAAKGNPDAQYRSGFMYEQDNDMKKAFHYYTQAAENGNTDAMYRLAYLYIQGGEDDSVTQDFKKAFQLLTTASNMGHIESTGTLKMSNLSMSVEEMINIKKMLEEIATSGNITVQHQLGCLNFRPIPENNSFNDSIKWFTMASEGGFIDAYYQLGLLYDDNSIQKNQEQRDYTKAFGLYKTAAAKGYEEALYRLARLYQLGKGVEQNYQVAFNIYNKAAQQGSHLAEIAIDIKKNPQNSNENVETQMDNLEYNQLLKMWEYVAKQGDTTVQYKLGQIYESSNTLSNYILAARWYSMAANKSHKNAMFLLGRLYEMGLGLRQDYGRAIFYYNKSSESGNSNALYRLGVLYHYGHGVDVNLKKARECYFTAAENGNGIAQFTLGQLYETGEILEQNLLEAFKWYIEAYDQEDEDAQDYLNTLYHELTKEDRFYYKWNHLLSLFIASDSFHYGVHFLGHAHYSLAYLQYYGYGTNVNYSEAWTNFYKAKVLYSNLRADDFVTFCYESATILPKENYIKRLTMFESVISKLDIDERFQLGLIYFFGVQTTVSTDNKRKSYGLVAKIESTSTVIEPNYKKASYYFQMASDQIPLTEYINDSDDDNNNTQLLDTIKSNAFNTYVDCSYYLAMFHYYDQPIYNKKIKYKEYLHHAADNGHSAAKEMLQHQLREDDGNAWKWFGEHEKATNNRIMEFNMGWVYLYGYGVAQDYEKAIEYITVAARKGYRAAQNHLGTFYYEGRGINKDVKQAIKWFLQAAEQKYGEANYHLGRIYETGEYVKCDYLKAFRYYKASAEQDYALAQYYLAYMYYEGADMLVDYNAAFEWFSKAASQNHPASHFMIATMYDEGTGVTEDAAKAFEHYKIAGELNYSEAYFEIGYCYFQGRGTKKDHQETFKWYKKAAEENSDIAAYNLAIMYEEADAIEKDDRKSFEYFKKAADAKLIDAYENVASCYTTGYGIEKDIDKAIEWYLKSEEEGVILSSYQLGQIYSKGEVIEKDYKKAFEHFDKAAAKGYKDAQFELGNFYKMGFYVQKDFKQAYRWYRKAADRNHPRSSYSIGVMYSKGEGLTKDLKKASKYFRKSAELGDSWGQIQLGEIYSYGWGTEKDLTEALKWHREAASNSQKSAVRIGEIYQTADPTIQNFSESLKCYDGVTEGYHQYKALRNVGLLYENGHGVEQDYQKSLEYYIKSSNGKHLPAYYNIALFYYYGKGVDQNFLCALEWFNKVIETDVEDEEVLHIFSLCLYQEHEESYVMYKDIKFKGYAHHYLGIMYKNGEGVAPDNEMAQSHFRTAIEFEVADTKAYLETPLD